MNPEIEKSLEDPEFNRILEESESYYEEAQSFYRWMPTSGQYICQLTGESHGTITLKKLKKETVWQRASVTILNGDLEGKEFDLTYGTIQNFNGLKTLASILQGEPVSKLAECLDVIASNVGAWLRVNVTRTPRKDGSGGDPWVNAMPTERLEQEDVEAEATTAPEVAPDGEGGHDPADD